MLQIEATGDLFFRLLANTDRPFKFHSQFFIRPHNVTLAAVAAIMVGIVCSIGGYKPPFPIPKTRSAFHRRAQRNAFRRRDARLQQRSFARENPVLRPSPKRFAAQMLATTVNHQGRLAQW